MTNLENLLQLEQQHPNDDKLLSQIAFYYLANPDGDKELDYFKKAYKANPSIKNTHNYAFWAYYEYGEIELALGLFKELITKNPKSFYPYMAYANLLFTPSDYSNMANIRSAANNSELIIELHKKSIEKFKILPKNYQQSHCYELIYIYNNLANIYTLNFDYNLANRYYDDALSELSDCYLNKDDLFIDGNQLDEFCYRINLNKTYLYLLMDDKKKASISLDIASQCKNCNMLEIAHIYALMGKSQKCYDLCKYEKYIDFGFSWIWSAICNIDPDFLQNQIDREKQQKQEIILDYQQELEFCNDEKRKLEIQEHIDCHTNRLEGLEIWKDIITIPSKSLEMECRSNLHYFYKCWLFGCESCGNLVDDE